MKQDLMKKFQVIGQYATMQTLSWEDELRLLDGVPYDIDFSRGASIEIPAGTTFRDIPVSNIIDAILSPPEVPALPVSTVSTCPLLDWDKVYRQMEKEKKREKKWRKKHPKRSPDEAYADLCNLLKEWGIS